jgi:imidazolonepropionase-like amidohydrolase
MMGARALPVAATVMLAGATLMILLGAAPARSQELVIVNGLVHTLAGEAQVQTVVVRDGVIAEVGVGITASPGATVIEAGDCVVTPGLVDFNSALGLVEIWEVDDTTDMDGGGDEIRAGFRALDGLNPQSSLIAVARLDGITSVVSHPSGGLVAGQSVWWDLAGDDLTEVRAQGPITMDMMGGAGAAEAMGGSRGTAWLRYRELFVDVETFQTRLEDNERGQMRDLTVSRVDLEALVPVVNGELPVYFQANSQADISAALRLADESVSAGPRRCRGGMDAGRGAGGAGDSRGDQSAVQLTLDVHRAAVARRCGSPAGRGRCAGDPHHR